MQKKSSQNERKKILLLSLLVILLAGGWIIFGPYGALKYYQLKTELNNIHAQNQQMKEENEGLRKEIHKLTNDRSYLEEIARKKYGLIKKNEIIFEFEEKKRKKH